MKRFNRTIIVLATAVIFLTSINASYALYNPSTGRFDRMDPFTGKKEEPQSLHKYTYCQNNPVNRVDPSGNYSTTETLTVTTITAQEIGISLWASWMVYNAARDIDATIARRVVQQEIDLFLQTNPQPFTQYQFEQLENRIRARTRSRQTELLYLHYSYEDQRNSLLQGLYPGSYGTRQVYPTGWTAKWFLALPGSFHNGNPPNSVYFVYPRTGFSPYGPTGVKGDWDAATPRRWMGGGGKQFQFISGSGGIGTVSGPLRIPIGEYKDWTNFAR
ncbi:MAG: hypothetical protein JW749_02520 [Sedimentisphaerales bacterium]|nr:hypothetical protein [Sedimentisphaerales bacterium]